MAVETVAPPGYDHGTVQITEAWRIISRSELDALDAQAEAQRPTTTAEGVELIPVERDVVRRLIRQAALVVP